MSALLLSAFFAVWAPQEFDVLVVCPPKFVKALEPWLEHRARQGYHCQLVSPADTPEEIRAVIRRVARDGTLKHLVLVGDADPRSAFDEQVRGRSTPTHQAVAQVNVHWGSEPEIATDNWYADLDDDQVPDLTVGRLPADSPSQLRVMVDKILRYEQTADMGPWRRRINFVAGVGGFGALADSVLEATTKKFLKDEIPAAYSVSMTYGSWRSAFCPDPRHFHQAAIDRFNEGCLFWVYIGHGQRTFLDRLRVPGGVYHIFDTDDVPKLSRNGPAPIAVFLSCYTGAFDAPRDCLAEQMLKSRRGPVAVLCGSRVTMPYAMAVMGNELMGACFKQRSATLGEAILLAKQQMVASPDKERFGDSNRALLDAIAQAISPAPELLDQERREHLLLFNLLGDPLLRLEYPRTIEIAAAEIVRAGERLAVTVESDISGKGTIELVCRRDRTRRPPPWRTNFVATHEALSEYSQVYAEANDRCWAEQSFACQSGKTQVELSVPLAARGQCYARVFVEGREQFGLGATKVHVRRPSQASTKR